jgi:hypothetical protein
MESGVGDAQKRYTYISQCKNDKIKDKKNFKDLKKYKRKDLDFEVKQKCLQVCVF